MRRKSLWVVVAIALAAATSLAQNGTSVWTGVYTKAQAERGAELYADTCAACHGNDLEGIERAPALAGGTFGQRWDGATLKKLFERVQDMPPGDPAKRLTDQRCVDVLAFLLRENGMPAGTAAMDADTTALAGITFSATKPK